MRDLPTLKAEGPRPLLPNDYLQLAMWQDANHIRSGRLRHKQKRKDKMPARVARILSQFLGDFEWHDEFVHVYTDGSCHYQQYPWLRRSGAGVYWGPDHPLNTITNQSGQAHTSPRAELLAIVIAIEQARWPIHIFSDNQGFVIAVKKMLSGDQTPSLKNNVDLWANIDKKLHSKQTKHTSHLD